MRDHPIGQYFFRLRNAVAIHYAVRIFIGTAIIESLLKNIPSINPLWAIISLIVISDPYIKMVWATFTARLINTLIGCMVGLFFLFAFGLKSGFLPLAASGAALLSIYVTRMQQGWRIGPVTVVLIMSAGIMENSMQDTLQLALHRVLAVLLGSVVAVAITWVMSLMWVPVTEQKKTEEE